MLACISFSQKVYKKFIGMSEMPMNEKSNNLLNPFLFFIGIQTLATWFIFFHFLCKELPAQD
jgi:hypothetical protein